MKTKNTRQIWKRWSKGKEEKWYLFWQDELEESMEYQKVELQWAVEYESVELTSKCGVKAVSKWQLQPRQEMKSFRKYRMESTYFYLDTHIFPLILYSQKVYVFQLHVLTSPLHWDILPSIQTRINLMMLQVKSGCLLELHVIQF